MTIQENDTELTEAEGLGIVVAQALGKALAERDVARSIAARLEQELAIANGYLAAVHAAGFQTSWAKDQSLLDDVRDWVLRDE